MATNQQEMTPEQIKEAKRNETLNLLDSERMQGLRDLAISFLVETGNGFGERDKNLADNFLYRPALASGTGLIINPETVLQTRTGNRRYSENIPMYNVLRDAADVFTGSLVNLKVNDLATRSGYEGPINERYDGKYVSDVLQGADRGTQEKMARLMATYQTTAIEEGLTRAKEGQKQALILGLEEILNPQENQSQGARQ